MKNAEQVFRQSLKKYYRKRFENLLKHLEDYIREGEYESLHKLRVEVKKISALLHLAEYASGKFFAEERIKVLNKLFKRSGKIRSYDINRKLAGKYCRGFTVPLMTPGQIAALKNKLSTKSKKYKKRLLHMQETCETALLKTSQKQLQEYLEIQKRGIVKFINKPNLENLHAERKRIKDEIYLDKLLPLKDNIAGEKGRLNRYIKLQGRIGDWHDTDKFISQLKAANSGKTPAGLQSENERRIKLIEKEISVWAGKKIHINREP